MVFKVHPDRRYRLRPDSAPISHNEDIIGLNFHPAMVVLDNLREYRFERDLVKTGITSIDAPIARYVKKFASEDEFIEALRKMVYDVRNRVTLEKALGGPEIFNKVVSEAKHRVFMESLPEPPEDPHFYEPDNH